MAPGTIGLFQVSLCQNFCCSSEDQNYGVNHDVISEKKKPSKNQKNKAHKKQNKLPSIIVLLDLILLIL